LDFYKDISNNFTEIQLEKAQWNKCGRENNAFARLTNNKDMCIRYRHPEDQLITGNETFL